VAPRAGSVHSRSATSPKGGGGCVSALPLFYMHCALPSTSLARHNSILSARPLRAAISMSPPPPGRAHPACCSLTNYLLHWRAHTWFAMSRASANSACGSHLRWPNVSGSDTLNALETHQRRVERPAAGSAPAHPAQSPRFLLYDPQPQGDPWRRFADAHAALSHPQPRGQRASSG
jgi:hypothetical protein